MTLMRACLDDFIAEAYPALACAGDRCLCLRAGSNSSGICSTLPAAIADYRTFHQFCLRLHGIVILFFPEEVIWVT
jgi:hypothetical protein